MPIQQVSIETFLQLSEECPVIDVRSPAEYEHAHIPGAFPLALFNNDQRKIIGTAYKKQSRQIAVNIGVNYFSERMKKIHKEALTIFNQWNGKSENVDFDHFSSPPDAGFLIHCWRGGMRSGTVAWLLNLYGYKIYVLEGGYKTFRNWVLAQFEKKYSFKILGGFTGSGKTEVLKEMRNEGKQIIDLESLASHKGSAFGALGENQQPAQEMFENRLAMELWKISNKKDEYNINGQTKITDTDIWLEDESMNIGKINIPKMLWEQMRESPLFFLDIPFEQRLDYIVSIYGNFDKTELKNSIIKLQKRLGGLDTKNALDFLEADKPKDSFSILMRYYDKVYSKALHTRENVHTLLNKIPAPSVDTKNSALLI